VGHSSIGYRCLSMGAQARNNGHETDGTLSLPGGHTVSFRVIQPDDVPALQRFHERLSEQTVYLRFFGSMEEFSEEKAQYFAHVDGADHFALVALDPDDPDEIIAIVRYDREPESQRAEYAALVEDRWQDHGLGIRLTHHLIETARDKGVRFLYGLVMPENQRMLNLLRHLDLPEQERREEGIKHFEVDLNPKASNGQDERDSANDS
jgi:GNAT superfamily N-acetyltransferase